MSSLPIQVARVSSQLSGSVLLNNLQSEQANLLKVQTQLSSGQQLSLPSDNPAAALGIVGLKQQIADNTNYSSNLDFVSGSLSQADSSLGSLNGLITQAQSIASSQIGASSTADQRSAQAQVISSLISQALDIANQQYQGQSIFGGQNGLANPFVSTGGGYKYQGTTQAATILTPTGESLAYTLSGNQAFGALSSQVVGYQNLTPALTGSTRLIDLNGAQGKGISTGPINITVGSTTVTADLSHAATVSDVVNIVNAALTGAGSTANISYSGGSFVVNGDATQNVTISDSQGGSTAADLGIALSVVPGGSATGTAVGPKITDTTPLSALNNGAGIDPSGIVITNGSNTATITLNGMTTVQDLLNAINGSGTNVQAQINAAGTGINLLNPLSGTQLTVGENGGNTANELGVRSMNATTNLSNLNDSTGVTPIAGTIGGPTGHILITKTDGTQLSVAVNGVSTPSQLIAAINNATGNGGTVTASLNTTGNGITLTDTSGGSGNITVTGASDYVSNGSNLGIFSTGTGGALTGSDIIFSTDDFRVTRQDGTSFTVSVNGAATIQDVLNDINNADGNTNPANKVTASLNTTGNGIQLTDASTGSGALTVTALNSSSAADQLGIDQTAASGAPGVIHGSDVNPIQPQGVFTSLTMLQTALEQNDSAGIQRAAQLLQNDSNRAIEARGVVGAQEQDASARQSQVTSEQTQLQQSLSLLSDTDFTTAATQLQQLQTAYQASLEVASTTDNMSLLDFLK